MPPTLRAYPAYPDSSRFPVDSQSIPSRFLGDSHFESIESWAKAWKKNHDRNSGHVFPWMLCSCIFAKWIRWTELEMTGKEICLLRDIEDSIYYREI